jgi:hypothetical protein
VWHLIMLVHSLKDSASSGLGSLYQSSLFHCRINLGQASRGAPEMQTEKADWKKDPAFLYSSNCCS